MGKKMTKEQLRKKGKKIMNHAKQIWKDHPNMKWQTAVGQSAKELKREHKI